MTTELDFDAATETGRPRPAFDVLLVELLADTDMRVGRLHVAEPIPEEQLESLDPLRDRSDTGWMTSHQVEIVADPTRGALLLRDVVHRSHEPEVLLRDRIERVHEQLVELQRKLRRRLDEDDFWRGRPIALGVGVVVRADCPETARPRRIPDRLIVDRPGERDFASRIRRLFEYYATPATLPVEKYGARLVDDLTESPEWIGNFIDEEAISTMRPSLSRSPDDAA